jgi:hypothetical protein
MHAIHTFLLFVFANKAQHSWYIFKYFPCTTQPSMGLFPPNFYCTVGMMNSMNSCMEEYIRSSLVLRVQVQRANYSTKENRPRLDITASNSGKMPLANVEIYVSMTSPLCCSEKHMKFLTLSLCSDPYRAQASSTRRDRIFMVPARTRPE